MKRIALYPGTFDPITMGHLDIIKRASRLFDELYVVILSHPDKKTKFSIEERLGFLKDSTKTMDHIIVDSSILLSVEYAKKINAKAIIRGLRAATDFEYELQIAAANQFLDDEIEMLFLMSRPENSFISSSTVKEMASYGRDVTGLVPDSVSRAFMELKKTTD